MNFCFICNKKFKNIDKHIKKYHYSIPEKNNKGNKLCPLCGVRVGNLQRHRTSALHRHNVLKNAVVIKGGLEEYKTYFDKHGSEDTSRALNKKDGEEENFFWTSARNELDEEDYKKLKEYVNDREKSISGYTRHSGLRRFSRASKEILSNVVDEKSHTLLKFIMQPPPLLSLHQ